VRIRKDNVANALLRHDWVHRLRTMLESVGVAPAAAMLARESPPQDAVGPGASGLTS